MQQIKQIFKWGLIISTIMFLFIFPITNGLMAFGITWFLNTVAKAIDIVMADIIIYGAGIIQTVGAVMIISFLMLVYISTQVKPKYTKKTLRGKDDIKIGRAHV